jgi:U4/U6.U5 tri-snRNP-associated protein 2
MHSIDVEDKRNESRYSIIANIVHEGKPEPGQGSFKCLLYHKTLDQWFSIQDLYVEEIMPQMVSLGESYIQVRPHCGFYPQKRFRRAKTNVLR